MPRTASAQNQALLERSGGGEDLFEMLNRHYNPHPELPDIVTFAESPEFLNLTLPLYPRQRTILRLIFNELEMLTPYDEDVINEWAQSFYAGEDTIGVPPDIFARMQWLRDHGYDHFHEILFVGGRRGGKGHLGAIIANRQMYRLLRMGVPQLSYGIDPNKELVFFVVATNFQQARDNQFADVLNMAVDAPCFDRYRSRSKNYYLTLQTEGDRARLRMQKVLGIEMDAEVATIMAAAITSNSKAARGRASLGLAFDELAHMLTGSAGPRTAEEVYQALTPSLDQLGKDSIIYEPSSPYTKIGQMFELYTDALMNQSVSDTEAAKLKSDGELVIGVPGHFEYVPNPNMLVVQLPSWGPYEDAFNQEIAGVVHLSVPAQYDDQAKRIERRDPIKFKVERKAQWAEVLDAYLSPDQVEMMFEPFETSEGLRSPEFTDHGVLRWSYRGHADPSMSQANFAAAIGHVEPVVTAEGTFPHVFMDRLIVWRPEDFENHQVDYIYIEEELADIISHFQTMEKFTYDQYGAFATVALMKEQLRSRRMNVRVKQEPFDTRKNFLRAERFKTALGLGWVHSPRDTFGNDGSSLLENEMKFLQLKGDRQTPRVVPQTIGPVKTKDLWDCVAVVTSELLKDNLDQYLMRENFSQPLAVGAQGGYSTHMQTPPEKAGSARERAMRFSSGASTSRGPKVPWGSERRGQRRYRQG